MFVCGVFVCLFAGVCSFLCVLVFSVSCLCVFVRCLLPVFCVLICWFCLLCATCVHARVYGCVYVCVCDACVVYPDVTQTQGNRLLYETQRTHIFARYNHSVYR